MIAISDFIPFWFNEYEIFQRNTTNLIKDILKVNIYLKSYSKQGKKCNYGSIKISNLITKTAKFSVFCPNKKRPHVLFVRDKTYIIHLTDIPFFSFSRPIMLSNQRITNVKLIVNSWHLDDYSWWNPKLYEIISNVLLLF